MVFEGWIGRGDWVAASIALLVVAAFAYAVAEWIARVARLLFVNVIERGSPVSFTGPIVRRPIRIVRAAVFLGTFATLALPALDLAGLATPPVLNSTAVGIWLVQRGIRIALIAVLTYLFMRIIAATADRLEREISRSSDRETAERLKRARTLSGLLQNILTAIVVSIAGLMILNQLQIDIMPILTGAGIVGLAVGFGAQTVVKDLIAGFFLIFENQVRIGDVAEINGTGGLVEAITLRTIVLRDLEGTVHVFPNGSVERLSNRTKDFSFAVLNLGVAYKENVDTVFAALREIGAGLAADPAFSASILEPLEILGVDDFGDSQVTIKLRVKTLPLKQWEIGRELRRRIKNSFDERHIEIPFPHLSVYVGEHSKPLLVQPTAPAPGAD